MSAYCRNGEDGDNGINSVARQHGMPSSLQYQPSHENGMPLIPFQKKGRRSRRSNEQCHTTHKNSPPAGWDTSRRRECSLVGTTVAVHTEIPLPHPNTNVRRQMDL